MECNKDEAARAKSIAEAKLENKDFISAKKFALKAQTLYPGLDGISKMLMTIDVYISAENRINNQINWYGVLGVAHTANEETIRKQYRKLALMLHPDKNNSVGADGAFKLIGEASSLLSDKQKRLSYNLITGVNGPQQKVPTNTTRPGPSNVHPTNTTRPSPVNVHPGPSNVQQKVPTKTCRPGPVNVQPSPSNVQQKAPAKTTRPGPSNVHPGPSNVQQKVPTKSNRPGPHPTSTGKPSPVSSEGPFTNSGKGKPSAPKPQKKTAKVAPAPPKPSPAPVKSFWTTCSKCRFCHEYAYMYRNATILCPECKSPFLASEIPKPVTKPTVPKPGLKVPVQRRQQQRQSENNNINNDRIVPDAKKPGVGQTGPKIQRQTQRAPSSTSTKSNASMDGSKKKTKLERNEVTGGSKKKTKLNSHNGDK